MVLAGLFPGQGSQAVGMGKELSEGFSAAREVFDEADKWLGFELSKLCFEGPIEELTLTQFAQPALLTTSFAAFCSAEVSLNCAAGHSLGEYSALVAAGSISFADAVQLVHKRGLYMQEAVPTGQGTMAAVMGPTPEEIQAIIDELGAEEVIEVANYNCPGQTVVAGSTGGVLAFKDKMQAAGGKVIPLNVSAPFHCSMMKPAADMLAADLDATTFKDPMFPVYANVSAKAVTKGDEARELLKQQVCASVRWTESMQQMIAERSITNTIEFGPGGVLTKLLKRIDKSVSGAQIFDAASLEKAKG